MNSKAKQNRVEPMEPAKPIEVKPDRVKINEAHQAWRTVLVRMPEGAIADDLRTPGIWRLVQQNPQVALVKLDHILVLGYREDWYAQAIVSHATNAEAHLVILRTGSFREDHEQLYADDRFQVVWDGASYRVIEKRSGQPASSTGWHTAALAENHAKSLHPKAVA